jgi:hypothetical protein
MRDVFSILIDLEKESSTKADDLPLVRTRLYTDNQEMLDSPYNSPRATFQASVERKVQFVAIKMFARALGGG